MRLHENTTFDPDAEAVALVTKAEAEVLDDVQMIEALSTIIDTLASRRQASVERMNIEVNKRVEDNRKDLLKAKAKGVKPIAPVAPNGQIVKPAAVISDLRMVR